MDMFDLNESPQLPDLSGVKKALQSKQKLQQMNFIGNVIINNKTQFTKSDFSKMFREQLEGIRRDTSI